VKTILMLAMLALAAPVTAQSTPESAAAEYLRVLRTGDWDQTARLMHPDALSELKGFFVAMADADSAGIILRPMFGVASADELRQLPPEDVYARLLRGVARSAPQLITSMRGMESTVIGSVPEGDQDAHVVYRLNLTLNGVTSTKVDVLSFRRSGDRWMGLLSGDLRALAQTLARELPRHAP
jgi:hypothetical protein